MDQTNIARALLEKEIGEQQKQLNLQADHLGQLQGSRYYQALAWTATAAQRYNYCMGVLERLLCTLDSECRVASTPEPTPGRKRPYLGARVLYVAGGEWQAADVIALHGETQTMRLRVLVPFRGLSSGCGDDYERTVATASDCWRWLDAS
jgi:hypothetical protein